MNFYLFFLSFVCTFLLILLLLPYFRKLQGTGQPMRQIGPVWHIQTKSGTPTMGGLFIIFVFCLIAVISCPLTADIIFILSSTILYACVGFCDDYWKLKRKNTSGASGTRRFAGEFIIGILLSTMLYMNKECNGVLQFGNYHILNIGFLYPIFCAFVMTSTANAVNLTDGLDGLAIGSVISTLVVYLFVIDKLSLDAESAAPLLTVTVIFLGASLGYLWFNSQPASIIMGDVGSLGIGAFVASLAICIRQELFLILAGLIFVIETLSVILQVASYKMRGKRIFLMSPIHHHFEKAGVHESKIVVRFWIVNALAGIALIALIC